MALKKISPNDLICMDTLTASYPFEIHLDYARGDNFLFGEQIYREGAKLYLHKDLAQIVIKASQYCHETYGLRFVLYDGLRTIEAQEAMIKTRRALENPHWMEPPRLLSTPGTGGHPRAMAIDIGLKDKSGVLIDMGCPFDYLAHDPSPERNIAHRDYNHVPHILENRAKLDKSMDYAAKELGLPLFPLPQEWWDFRMPPEIHDQYAPISEDDLPDEMKLLDSLL